MLQLLGVMFGLTNSGESILERWERNRGLHGATPTEAGVVDWVDIVRARLWRRESDLGAILMVY